MRGHQILRLGTVLVFLGGAVALPLSPVAMQIAYGEPTKGAQATTPAKDQADPDERYANEVKGKGGDTEVKARYRSALHLLSSKKYKEAADEFAWLWRNIPREDPAMVGVRGSFMIGEMKRLLAEYPDARPRFVELRTEAEASENRNDWIELNSLLDESDKTLSWFEMVKERPDQADAVQRADFLLEPLLVQKNRWSDIGAFLYKDPMKELRDQYEFSQTMKKFYKEQRAKASHSMPLEEYDTFSPAAATLYAALLAAGRDVLAESVASESFRLNDSKELRTELARRAYQAGQSRPEQLKWLEDVKPDTVTDMPFYEARAALYCQIKQYGLALKDYDKLMQLKGGDSRTLCLRGNVLVILDQYRQAIDDYNRAITLEPTCAYPLAARGYAFFKLGEQKAAMDDFTRALEMNPKDSLTWSNMADGYFEWKKYSEAYDAAARALLLDPNNIDAVCNKGEAALRLGHYEEALPLLTSAIEKGSSEIKGEAHFYRAELYDKTGKPELSKEDKAAATKFGFKRVE